MAKTFEERYEELLSRYSENYPKSKLLQGNKYADRVYAMREDMNRANQPQQVEVKEEKPLSFERIPTAEKVSRNREIRAEREQAKKADAVSSAPAIKTVQQAVSSIEKSKNPSVSDKKISKIDMLARKTDYFGNDYLKSDSSSHPIIQAMPDELKKSVDKEQTEWNASSFSDMDNIDIALKVGGMSKKELAGYTPEMQRRLTDIYEKEKENSRNYFKSNVRSTDNAYHSKQIMLSKIQPFIPVNSIESAKDLIESGKKDIASRFGNDAQYYVVNDLSNEKKEELRRESDARDTEQITDAVRDIAKKNKAAGTAINLASNLLTPLGFVETVKNNLGNAVNSVIYGKNDPRANRTVNTNSKLNIGANMEQASREGLLEDIDNGFAKFLAETGLSTTQFLTMLPFGTASLAVMATGAAAQAANDASERGATSEQALLSGAAAGFTELIMEKIPLDNLFKIAKQGGKSGVMQLIGEIFEQAGIEAAGETLTELANAVSDIAIMGNKSEYALYAAEHGVHEAWIETVAKPAILAGASGFLSGGTLGAGATAASKLKDANSQFINGRQPQTDIDSSVITAKTAENIEPKQNPIIHESNNTVITSDSQSRIKETAQIPSNVDADSGVQDKSETNSAAYKVSPDAAKIADNIGMKIEFDDMLDNINGYFDGNAIRINPNITVVN